MTEKITLAEALRVVAPGAKIARGLVRLDEAARRILDADRTESILIAREKELKGFVTKAEKAHEITLARLAGELNAARHDHEATLQRLSTEAGNKRKALQELEGAHKAKVTEITKELQAKLVEGEAKKAALQKDITDLSNRRDGVRSELAALRQRLGS